MFSSVCALVVQSNVESETHTSQKPFPVSLCYVDKVTIDFQGTFLVGQPGGSGKQSSGGHVASSPASSTQQAIRVTAGQKAAILAQVCNKVRI